MGEFRWSRHQARQKQDRFSVIKSCRIQAGLGDGLILIQSSVDGGSRFTVKAAIELNRLLGVIYPVKTDMSTIAKILGFNTPDCLIVISFIPKKRGVLREKRELGEVCS